MEVADEQRYAKDLLSDPWIQFVDRTFVLWVVAGLAAAFGLGVALTGTVFGGLTALLWGGAARIFFVHHATFSINSVCHYFGKADYDTGDESRNVFWLAIPTWGESWHNNHHAFPTSYRHGLRRWQLDPSAGMIRLLEMMRAGVGRGPGRPLAPRAQAAAPGKTPAKLAAICPSPTRHFCVASSGRAARAPVLDRVLGRHERARDGRRRADVHGPFTGRDRARAARAR